MKRLLLLYLLVAHSLFLLAQHQHTHREIVSIDQFTSNVKTGVQTSAKGIRSALPGHASEYIQYAIPTPLHDITPFLAFTVKWEARYWDPANDAIWVRFNDGNTENTWTKMDIDVHTEQQDNTHISELTFAHWQTRSIDLKIVFGPQSTATIENIDLHFFSPGITKQVDKKSGKGSVERSACTCPQPDFQTRAEWCPTGECPPNPNPAPTTVSHLIIHHSAGTNVSSDWAGVVRSIWDYHVNINGWSDIGYNWLVDPNGVLYEGRGDNILGAHFCGTNTNTMGVCVMGDFTNMPPTNNAEIMLTNLLTWKICDIDADPEETASHPPSGLVLHRISGHQDGCATACPGASFYPELPDIRMQVADQIENECAEMLAAPSNLTADLLSGQSLELSWQDNSDSETAFLIERSFMNAVSFELVGTTGTDETTLLEQGLQENSIYFYKVSAANAQDTSDFSNIISIATIFTSNEELEKLPLVIYPNPMNDWLFINAAGGESGLYQFNIFEMVSSQLVKNFAMDLSGQGSGEKVDISALPRGAYMLQITNGSIQQYVKLIKR